MGIFKKIRANRARKKFLERGSEESFEGFIKAVERLNQANQREMLDGMLSETVYRSGANRFASILLYGNYAPNLKIRFLNLLSCLSLESQEKIISKRFQNGIISCNDGSCGPNNNYDVLLCVVTNTSLRGKSEIIKPLLTIISKFSEEVRREMLLNSAICSERFLLCRHSGRLVKPSRDGRISNTLDWITDQFPEIKIDSEYQYHPEISECTTSGLSESQATQQQESKLGKDQDQVSKPGAHEQFRQVNESPSSLRFFDSRSRHNHATMQTSVESGKALEAPVFSSVGL